MKHKYKIALFVIAALIFTTGPVLSQADFRDKIENIKLEKLTKKLELDETTKSVFIDKYKAFSKTMRELNKGRAKAYKLMTENIESGDGLDSIVAEVLDYEKQISDKREDF